MKGVLLPWQAGGVFAPFQVCINMLIMLNVSEDLDLLFDVFVQRRALNDLLFIYTFDRI